jgi:hypothetical protein
MEDWRVRRLLTGAYLPRSTTARQGYFEYWALPRHGLSFRKFCTR